MTIYDLCKRLIESGSYDRESMMAKLDIFLLTDRITTEQYNELVAIINRQHEGGDQNAE